MKKLIYSFLVWCSGSDAAILEKCPRSEHIKHACFGALVLIPAILSLFSMSYAISTFVDNHYLIALAAITWAGIVFTFDRLIVSTFRKRDSVLQDVMSITFVTRLIFSVFVGIAVAHPLALLYFNDSIEVNMDEQRRSKITGIENDFIPQIKNYQTAIDTIDRDIKRISDKIFFQEEIIHDEIMGNVRKDKQASGKPGEGPTFRYDTATLRRLNNELAETKKSVEKKKLEYSIAIAKLDSIKTKKINQLTFSRDYLEREKALSSLSNSNSIINVTVWFMIIFFILVDILPVTWKALTKRGPYDDYLEENELIIRNQSQERKVDSKAKIAIYKRDKERNITIHSDNKRAEENANREYSESLKKDMLKRVFHSIQSYKADTEIYNERFNNDRDFRNRIIKEEKEFIGFFFKAADEIEKWKECDLKEQAFEHLDELKKSFNDTVESTIEEHRNIQKQEVQEGV